MIHDGQMEDILSMMEDRAVQRIRIGTSFVDAGVLMAPVPLHQDSRAYGFLRVALLVAQHVIPTLPFLGTKIFVAMR